MARVRSVDLGSSFLSHLDGVCEVLLVRHGEQVLAQHMTLAEAVDSPLSALGERQAAAVSERLANTSISAVYSSHLQRARNTAEAIASQHRLGVTELSDLGEIHLWRDLAQDRPLSALVEADELRGIMQAGNRTQRWDAYPYAEPRDEFRARIVAAIDLIIANHVGQRVVVTCHGGVINGYLAHAMSSSLDTPCTLHHTSVTTVRAMGALRRVVQVNDFEHVLPFQSALNPNNAL